jgi:hypothetical protein
MSLQELAKGRLRQIILTGVVVLYALCFSFSYMGDPLAQSPQLDARENLVLATAIDTGSLPEEPVYRAMVYPWLLSHLHPADARPLLALLLGLGLHLVNMLLACRLANRIWSSRNAGLLAVLLYGLNPASLFYALQILDVTLAITFFLLALLCAVGQPLRFRSALGTGIFLGLAVVTRPHFLPLALVMPPLAILFHSVHNPRPLLAWVPLAAILMLQGFVNQLHSGEFRILPWQGSYNLWAANKAGANGLYFKQAVDLSQRGDASNPARVESVYLYGQAHPEERPPYSIDAMNGYWRSRFLEHLKANPLEVARLWLFKAYAVVNSSEQYNNLTFSFHKERLPILRYNPLNWGILLILGTLGLIHLWRVDSRKAFAWVLLMLAYASMLILFYASARFRLPLVPLMAVLAGGSIHWFNGLLKDHRCLAATLVSVTLVGGITFSSFAGIKSTDTYIQDRLLMANANAELGKDAEAARWARDVLEDSPGRPEAVTIYALSYFNLRLEGASGSGEFGSWDDQAGWLQLTPTQDPATAAVFACYLWHWDRQDDATGIWRQIASNHPEPTNLANRILSMLNKDAASLTTEDLVLKGLLEEN